MNGMMNQNSFGGVTKKVETIIIHQILIDDDPWTLFFAVFHLVHKKTANRAAAIPVMRAKDKRFRRLRRGNSNQGHPFPAIF